ARPQPSGAFGDDGRSYVNRRLGFSFRIPEPAAGWKFRRSPQVAMEVASPDGVAHLNVRQQQFPLAAEMDLRPLFEMGLKSAIPGYRSLGSSPIEVNGQAGFELRYEAGSGDDRVRATQRIF